MGTTKSRKSRRNNSRPTAFSFLSNIALGNEEKPPDIRQLSNYISEPKLLHFVEENTQTVGDSSLHSSDSSFSADEENIQTTLSSDALGRSNPNPSPPVIIFNEQRARQLKYDSTESIEHHKLTREDSERPIASEKIKKRSNHAEKAQAQGNLSIMSVFRYYTDKIRQSTSKKSAESPTSRGYVQQQLENNDRSKYRVVLSYANFLNPTGSLSDGLYEEEEEEDVSLYNPFFLDNDMYEDSGSGSTTSLSNNVRPADKRREMNEHFRQSHPEIPIEITLSKIRAIKEHLIEISKQVDLEISSVANAFVYFEKLVIKNMVTKKNRKLIAACCLFLASKVNEAKGNWFKPLLDSIYNELGIDAEDVHEHEFAVFADLEFDLYVRRREFMPHFERILKHLENKSLEEYLGNSSFYKVNERT